MSFYGLVNHPYPDLVRRFLKSMGWDFPTTIITDSLYDEGFCLSSTPIKILLRGNKILYIEGALSNWRKESKIKKYIHSFIKKSNKEKIHPDS